MLRGFFHLTAKPLLQLAPVLFPTLRQPCLCSFLLSSFFLEQTHHFTRKNQEPTFFGVSMEYFGVLVTPCSFHFGDTVEFSKTCFIGCNKSLSPTDVQSSQHSNYATV